jgi:hypothetical protein
MSKLADKDDSTDKLDDLAKAISSSSRSWQWKSRMLVSTLPVMRKQVIRRRKRFVVLLNVVC